MKSNKSKVDDKDKKASKITLAAYQDISIISNLHGRLKKCATTQVDVNLIADNVESIDTSTLQLLLSFVRQIRRDGNSVNWQSPSQVLLNAAGLIGLDEEFFSPQSIEGRGE